VTDVTLATTDQHDQRMMRTIQPVHGDMDRFVRYETVSKKQPDLPTKAVIDLSDPTLKTKGVRSKKKRVPEKISLYGTDGKIDHAKEGVEYPDKKNENVKNEKKKKKKINGTKEENEIV